MLEKKKQFITLVNPELPLISDLKVAQSKVRECLSQCVKERIHADRPIGALLSGGLDSSLTASLMAKYLKEEGQVLNTFSIGMPGSTDKVFAEMVAKHIGSKHTHVELKEQDFLDAVE